MKQGSFPPAGLCCPSRHRGTTTPSDSLMAACHFPALAGYRQALLPEPRRLGATEGLSSSHDNLPTVPRLLRRRVPWHPLQAPRCRPWPSPSEYRLGSPLAACAVILNDAAGFASCCGPVGCPPRTGGGLPPPRHRDLARRRECCYRGPWRLPGPDSPRLAAVSLSLGYPVAPSLRSHRRPSYWTHIPRNHPPPREGLLRARNPTHERPERRGSRRCHGRHAGRRELAAARRRGHGGRDPASRCRCSSPAWPSLPAASTPPSSSGCCSPRCSPAPAARRRCWPAGANGPLGVLDEFCAVPLPFAARCRRRRVRPHDAPSRPAPVGSGRTRASRGDARRGPPTAGLPMNPSSRRFLPWHVRTPAGAGITYAGRSA
jgi:hypothetical protein